MWSRDQRHAEKRTGNGFDSQLPGFVFCWYSNAMPVPKRKVNSAKVLGGAACTFCRLESRMACDVDSRSFTFRLTSNSPQRSQKKCSLLPKSSTQHSALPMHSGQA